MPTSQIRTDGFAVFNAMSTSSADAKLVTVAPRSSSTARSSSRAIGFIVDAEYMHASSLGMYQLPLGRLAQLGRILAGRRLGAHLETTLPRESQSYRRENAQ